MKPERADFNLEILPFKDQRSLFRANLFYFVIFTFLLFMNWYVCKSSLEDINSAITLFKNSEELTCKNTFVSKTRGWSIDEKSMRFIKSDRFIDIKECKGDSHEQ